MQFYVYLHCLPNGLPFYVGKGYGNRAFTLWNNRNRHYKFVVKKYGKENIKVVVLPCPSETDAFLQEIQFIKAFREMGYNLTNKTDGGEGATGAIRNEITRLKMAQSKLGNKYTLGLKRGPMPKKQREKISATRRERNIAVWNKGMPRTDEVKAKLSASNKGKKLTLGLKYPPRSEEHKAKISAANKGRIFSPEHRTKLSMALRGKIKSPEHCINISRGKRDKNA
jgi:hypothetical protein